MSRILVTIAVVVLAAGYVFGSPEPAEGRNMPAIQHASGGECGPAWRISKESCPCKGVDWNWLPPYKSRRAPDMVRKHDLGSFAAHFAARMWWWSATWRK